MTEQEIRERLGRYLALRMENENQLERLARLKNRMVLPSVRAGDGTQHTGGGERMARSVENFLEEEKKIKKQIEENRQEMDRIRAMVETLPDPREREVLRLRYLDGDRDTCRPICWQEIAFHLYGSCKKKHVDAAMRLRQKAVNSIIFALNEVK